MGTFLAVFALFTLGAAGLGIGWLLKGRALKGTCASMSAMTGESCPVCGKTTSCGTDRPE
ncbi:MAG: hypothetical protein HYV18_09520 [Gammaproteobacteria bacterium]|nr:hypothetical protein [Gammaproteobacteria bacterium]